jgi:hypothetical protein
VREYAVPLNEADLAAPAHSALALGPGAWLAQPLHRVDPNYLLSSVGASASNSRPIRADSSR